MPRGVVPRRGQSVMVSRTKRQRVGGISSNSVYRVTLLFVLSRQGADTHQKAARRQAARGRRIHHLYQPDRDQNPRPVAPDVAQEKDIQVVEQEQDSDADYHQRRKDARNGTFASPIFMCLHEFSVRRRRPRVFSKSANAPVLPASAARSPLYARHESRDSPPRPATAPRRATLRSLSPVPGHNRRPLPQH